MPMPPKSRLTVVETVYHQMLGEPASSAQTRMTRPLDSDEQVYERHLVATEEWQSLDCGWVSEPDTIRIQNREGEYFQVNPTDEEREILSRRIVEVAYEDSREGFLIHPKDSIRVSPTCAERLRYRCLDGNAKIALLVYPGVSRAAIVPH